MGSQSQGFVTALLDQAEAVADELADRLSGIEGGKAIATRFCEQLLARLAETDRLTTEVLTRWGTGGAPGI